MMTEGAVHKLDHSRKLLLLAGWPVVTIGFLNPPLCLGQSQTVQSPTAARANLEFLAVSVKQKRDALRRIAQSQPFRKIEPRTSRVSEFAGKNMPLLAYIAFAYPMKFGQQYAVSLQLPSWVEADTFDIQARAEGNATETEVRQMMQSLLADRFKLAIHYETRQVPELLVGLVNSGKTGLRLQPHPVNAPCAIASGPIYTPIAGVFPATCGTVVGVQPSAAGRLALGGRNVSMDLIANSIPWMMGDMSKAGINQTELNGTTYDFIIEWTPRSGEAGTGQFASNFQPDPTGPTLQQALKDQLGLSVNSTQGPMQVLVIDHVEQPSEN